MSNKLSVKLADMPHEIKEIHEFKLSIEDSETAMVSPDPFEDNSMSGVISTEKASLFVHKENNIVLNFDIDIGKPVFLNTFLNHSIPVERFNSYPKKAVSITKYFFDPESFESEDLIIQLFAQLYYYQRSKEIKFDFVLVKKNQTSFFSKLGYFVFPNCKEMYETVPMVLITEGEGLLKTMNSPYHKISLSFRNPKNTSAWFEHNFKRKTDYEKAQTSKTDQTYKLAKYLSKAFLNQHFIFNHLSIYEIERVLNFANVLRFFKDEHIIDEGEVGNDFYIILTGMAKVQKKFGDDKPVVLAELETGQIFGEMAFISEQPRTADIIATENLQALRFTQATIKKLMTSMPDIASKILFNLSLVLCDRITSVNQKLMLAQREKDQPTESDEPSAEE